MRRARATSAKLRACAAWHLWPVGLRPIADELRLGVDGRAKFTAVQQFAGALGVAVLRTAYFGLLGDYTVAFQQTLWAVGVLLVLAFAAAYLLPKSRTSREALSKH